MNDQETVLDAYKDTLKQVYTTFFTGYVSADNPADQAQAEKLFVTGVTIARRIRDRALALLP
jgi:hypothetical protein